MRKLNIVKKRGILQIYQKEHLYTYNLINTP